jgi:predicted DNA-binding transcriptional regulator AlpA
MYSLEETAAKVRQSPQTLYNWRSQGKGPDSFKVGGKVFYRQSAINRFLAECGDTSMAAAR